jgi:Rrf2 family protein
MASNSEVHMSAAYLNEKLKIPYPYLRQILSNLSKSGFIHSTRGRNGGFKFSKPKEQIFLADIVDATDGLDTLNRCILGFLQCPFSEECAMHSVWEKTRNNIIKVLKETSLADLDISRT